MVGRTLRAAALGALCLSALGAGACRTAAPEAAPCPAARIVVLGSSTAEGAGASEAQYAWVSRYRRAVAASAPGMEVVNLAKGGYTTFHLAPTAARPPAGRTPPDTARNITRALALRPSAVVVNLPSNDTASRQPPAETLANYRAIAAAAAQAGAPLWFTTTQPRNLDAEGRRALQTLRDTLRAAYPGRVLDFWTGLALPDGALDPRYDSGDGIHLNDAGHALLAARAAQAPVLQTALRRVAACAP